MLAFSQTNGVKCSHLLLTIIEVIIGEWNPPYYSALTIDLLKVGLSGIAKRYGYQTVQDFYRAYHLAKNAYVGYQKKAVKWEETYGKNIQKPKKESVHEQLQRFQKEKAVSQVQYSAKSKSRGAR